MIRVFVLLLYLTLSAIPQSVGVGVGPTYGPQIPQVEEGAGEGVFVEAFVDAFI
jgi:hypothetical protein